jgi:hypothetical protein
VQGGMFFMDYDLRIQNSLISCHDQVKKNLMRNADYLFKTTVCIEPTSIRIGSQDESLPKKYAFA